MEIINLFSDVRKFLRPHKYYLKQKKFVLANGFCLIEFDFGLNEFIFFDKRNFSGYSLLLNADTMKMIFKIFVNNFNFNANKKFVEDVLYAVNFDISDKKILTDDEMSDYMYFSLNNSSFAELLAIPGMNMENTNRIVLYRLRKEFVDAKEFLCCARITGSNAEKFKNIFVGAKNICLQKRLNKIVNN